MKRRAFLAVLGTGSVGAIVPVAVAKPWWVQFFSWLFPKRVDPKQAILAQYINSAAGRRALAQSMIQPIRRPLDYARLSRSLVSVQAMPDGAMPAYSYDSLGEAT